MSTAAQLEEYKMLRSDIEQRIRFRFQLFGFLITLLGILLTYYTDKPDVKLLFAFPIIVFFVATNWIHQGTVIIKIARYLRDELEPKVKGLEWEAYVNRDSKRFSGFSFVGFFAASGFLLFSQLLTLSLGLIGSTGKTDLDIIFLKTVAIIATISTLIFFLLHLRMKR